MARSSQKVYNLSLFFFFIALFISLYPDVCFFGSSFMKRDIFRYYFPIWQFSVENLRQGQFPLWNPYSSYGTPFFANIQSCVLYPLSILLYLPDYLWAFNFYILIHLALSGFFVSLWMASCGASRPAQLLSGLAYCLGGYVMSSANVTISLCTLSYFPLVLLCLKKALREEGGKWKVATAAMLLMQYLAGDPAIFFASIVVLSMIVLYETLRKGIRQKKWSLTILKDTASIVLLFAGLSAFHLLLFIEFLFHSNRSAATAEGASRWSLFYNDLVSIIVPHFSDISAFFMDYWSRQSWVENNYVGVTVLILALIAVSAKRTAMIYRHAGLAVFGLLLALGPWGVVHGVLYEWFPFFKFIRYPARFMFLFNFAIACLAGFGLDAVLSKKTDHSHHRVLLAAILLLSLSVLAGHLIPDRVVAVWYGEARTVLQAWTRLEWTPETVKACLDPLIANTLRSLMFGVWMLVIVWIALTQQARRALLVLFTILIVFADLVEANRVEQRIEGYWLNPQTRTEAFLRKDNDLYRYTASPNTMQLYRQAPPYPSIEEALFALADGMAPNHHLAERLGYFGGYDSIYVKEGVDLSKRYRETKPEDSVPFMAMINAKYLINSDTSFTPYYKMIQSTALGDLCRNERALPRAYLVPSAMVLERDQMLTALFSASFEPQNVLYLDEDPAVTASVQKDTHIDVQESVRMTEYGLNHVKMTVMSSKDQWLFFSDAHYPGWVAEVNGDRTPIVRANYAFRAIRVPTGGSTVAWKYEPILFRIGVVISSFTLAFCWFLWSGRRRKNNGR